MKLRFLLVPLAVFSLAVGSYADCSKNEILKLIDKGFSKTEIDEICGKSEGKKEESKWFTPIYKLFTWKEAKQICRDNGGRLPTIEELKEVVVDCGGINTTSSDKDWKNITDKNIVNKVYQSAYKNKGFSSNGYWSSSTFKGEEDDVWVVIFLHGIVVGSRKDNTTYVRCVRDGQ